jgi:hypothetical protein
MELEFLLENVIVIVLLVMVRLMYMIVQVFIVGMQGMDFFNKKMNVVYVMLIFLMIVCRIV